MVPALVIEDFGTSTEIDEARILGIAEVDEADEAVVPEFSSPACSMHEASDAYMGYADQDEVTTICASALPSSIAAKVG